MSVNSNVERSEVLGPFVRRGIEGGCIACRLPISAHFDARGTWLGCQAVNLPEGIPFYLMPDRRLLGRRVTPAPLEPQERRQLPPPEVTRLDDVHVTDGETVTEEAHATPSARRHKRRTASQATVATAATQAQDTGGQRSQVAYVAKLPVTDKKILGLPPAAQKIYAAIAKHSTQGATRAQLLAMFKAGKHTGRVDGSVVRLRSKKVITVRSL